MSKTPLLGLLQKSDTVEVNTKSGKVRLPVSAFVQALHGVDQIEKGLVGPKGKDGKDGKDGTDGKNGTNGTNGRDGVRGPSGHDGKNGKDGKDGKTFVQFPEGDSPWFDALLEKLIKKLGRSVDTDGGTALGIKGKDGRDGLDGGFTTATRAQVLGAIRPYVIEDYSLARTLTADDENCIINFEAPEGPVVVTLPNESAVNLELGHITHLNRCGAAASLTVVPADGVTLRYAHSLVARAQYSSLSVTKVGPNTYLIIGDAE